MPFTRRSDGALEIKPTRTRTRAVFALATLLPVALAVLLFLGAIIYFRIWTLPLNTITLIAFGLLLSPATLGLLIGVASFPAWWDGTAVLQRDGRFVVFRRLMWGTGISHRVDIERLSALTVSVQTYPRDDADSDWKTSFRPRVTVQNGTSLVMGFGEGFSLEESAPLAAAVSELIGLSAGRVEQAHQPDGQQVD